MKYLLKACDWCNDHCDCDVGHNQSTEYHTSLSDKWAVVSYSIANAAVLTCCYASSAASRHDHSKEDFVATLVYR